MAFANPEPYPSGLGLALFLRRRGHEPTVLFADSDKRTSAATLRSWREKGVNVKSLFQEKLPGTETFYPEYLKNSWLTYHWLKARPFDAILFQDDSSAGLIPFQARKLHEAFASTRLGYYLHGPAQWSSHLRENRQLIKADLTLPYSAQNGAKTNKPHMP